MTRLGDTLYGIISESGVSGQASLFSVGMDGTGYTNMLYIPKLEPDFSATWLTFWGSKLYGTIPTGGIWQRGNVFVVNPDGTGFTNLHEFFLSDGVRPNSGLIMNGDTLYGACSMGGVASKGTLFKLNVDGSGFTTLYSFTNQTDGSSPYGKMVLIGTTLYGTTQGGGAFGRGSVFAVSTNGTDYTNLYSFSAVAPSQTNLDGSGPSGGLLLADNFFYGTTLNGGRFANGVVFKISVDGSVFTNLHSFTTLRSLTNSDGANPRTGLAMVGNTFYGATFYGGVSSNGTIFAINSDGTGFTNLHSFSALPASAPYTNSDGIHPEADLLVADNTLYGTAFGGGEFFAGTIFSVTVGPAIPSLNIALSASDVILTWTTNAPGFTLESATNLDGALNWFSVSPDPVIINRRYTVTNSVSGQQRFYRLKQ